MMSKLRALLRSLAYWLIDACPDPVVDRSQAWRLLRDRQPVEDEIDAALRAAFQDCGVNVDLYAQDLDLGTKKYEVLHHAANRLGNPLRTVADIKGLLQ